MRVCSQCLGEVAEGTCPRDGAPSLPLVDDAGSPPVDALAPGAMLTRAYRVERLIGAGGMGVVYEVEHVRLKKRFAAKLLTRDAAGDEEALGRLEREAVAASRIRHPNIVEVVNFDETDDGHTFIVEELLVGFDLSRLCTGAPLPAGLALALAVTCARALHSAHQAGIVHRDLKPANVFVARAGASVQVKVLDFGISKIVGDDERVRLTTTGAFIGTPAYMAPELAREGAQVDARTDVYSLGVIVYELLAGTPPFVSKNALDVALKHVMEPPPPLASKNAAVPEAVAAVVMRALAKAPDDRWPSMAAMADALEAAAQASALVLAPMPERTVLASSTPMLPPRVVPAPRGRPWGAWVAAAVGVAIAAWFAGRMLGEWTGEAAPVASASPASAAPPASAPPPSPASAAPVTSAPPASAASAPPPSPAPSVAPVASAPLPSPAPSVAPVASAPPATRPRAPAGTPTPRASPRARPSAPAPLDLPESR